MNNLDWHELTDAAWRVRDSARILGKTKVGAAVHSAQGHIFTGCNVEHRFRSHDIHAETNALTNMIAAGDGPATAVVIAAAREMFTPCGGCLDWIFELGGPSCIVAFSADRDADLRMWSAHDLMPQYPC